MVNEQNQQESGKKVEATAQKPEVLTEEQKEKIKKDWEEKGAAYIEKEVQKRLQDKIRKGEQQYGMTSAEEEEGVPMKGKGFGSALSMPTVLVMLVVSAVVAFGMLSFLSPSKSQYIADVTRLEKDLVELRQVNSTQNDNIKFIQTSSAAQTESAINGLKSTLGNYITSSTMTSTINSSLNDYAKKGDVTTAINTANSNNTNVTALKLDVANLTDENNKLKLRIAALESATKEITSPVPSVMIKGNGVTTAISAVSPIAGNYVVRVTLVYNTPVTLGVLVDSVDDANEAFKTQFNATDRVYIPEYTPTDKLSKIVFYSNSFELTANKAILTNLPFTVPPASFGTYTMYAEILGASTATTTTGSGI